MPYDNFPNYDIDVVFTWVDGDDDDHRKKLNAYLNPNQKKNNQTALKNRYNQINEIEYAIKSILKNATYVRNIFIVTDNQTPLFLKNLDSDHKLFSKVKIIDHKTIFKGYEQYLPTFNSRAIETLLYKIPDLAEHFLYFNDDFFLLGKTRPEDFFEKGQPVLRGKWSKFEEDVLYKQILSILKIKKVNKKRAGHKRAQQKGAKILGFNRYYKFHHTPSPLRKSTFQHFFKENKHLEEENIKYKLRNVNQFLPHGLINHVEIKNNTCVLKNDYQLVYFGSYKKPLIWFKLMLNINELRKNKLFLNMQNLTSCPESKLQYIVQWLKDKFN
ncbi:stealth family protein [Aureibaculum sp. 2210JD6-5]|uniref:stealth family protein n=1 Tax=Aureibaculum sp. 2210JD6-5 TaxID=3103957 RepID=UPI002AAD8B44|nr:stealth family protein [Aureibaculum sp. 2210JD6-5]MDY7393695.1 stealth family protein [Aureibaculum sp. 2210JD6-5]